MARVTNVAKFADMLAAMGAESHLRIVRLLLAAHPMGWSSARSAPNLVFPVPRSRITLKS